jgi:energy-coupling factor transporter ATP-binding protein EcfA2
MDEYHSGEKEINGISEKAQTEATRWMSVIDTFNKRFSVPFKLAVQNQDDVILKRDVPSIVFVFKDADGEASIKRPDLLQALSSGERRALYILNIIFEVEARKEEGQETLFIVDDIADSFDYKNKYAIIEYLKDISDERGFYQIILTHNFDFFRTCESRFVRYDHCLMVEKTSDEIKINKALYIRNPFINDWVENLNDDKKLIASIPFVRNLVEYREGQMDSKYLKLTSLLHIKTDSNSISKTELGDIYKQVLPNLRFAVADGDEKIIKLIFRLADDCLTATECINLENKILLSVAIRLKAEQIMFSRLSDKSEVGANQTKELFQRYKNEYKGKALGGELIELLERVNLMTPENIHFNSFMYEPILDMSDEHLRNLYREISALIP